MHRLDEIVRQPCEKQIEQVSICRETDGETPNLSIAQEIAKHGDFAAQRRPPMRGPAVVLRVRLVANSRGDGRHGKAPGGPYLEMSKNVQLSVPGRESSDKEPDPDPLESLRRSCYDPDSDAAVGQIAGASRGVVVRVRPCHLDAYSTPKAEGQCSGKGCSLGCHSDFKSKRTSWFLMEAESPPKGREQTVPSGKC